VFQEGKIANHDNKGTKDQKEEDIATEPINGGEPTDEGFPVNHLFTMDSDNDLPLVCKSNTTAQFECYLRNTTTLNILQE
jgi:hypothetical protein